MPRHSLKFILLVHFCFLALLIQPGGASTPPASESAVKSKVHGSHPVSPHAPAKVIHGKLHEKSAHLSNQAAEEDTPPPHEKPSPENLQSEQSTPPQPQPPEPAGPAESNNPMALIAFLELGVIAYLFYMYFSLKKELKAQQDKFTQLNTKLEFQALYDSLTQLPNRRLFRDRLLETIKLYNRNSTCFGIMVGDLDKFKEVNDSLGHDAGDLLLKEVTARLRKGVRDTDTLARIGGDEFALICPNVNDIFSASIVCNRLINLLKDPIVVKGKPFHVGISLGVALFPEHAADEDMLIRRADAAMYRAKLEGNSFQMYDDSIDRPKLV